MQKPNLGILIKPVGSDCNMACDYCYYRPAGRLYPDAARPRFTLDLFDAVCGQYLALQPREIKIGWQGGEPTMMGLDFFRQVIEVERRHARPGDCIGNSLQTNGVVLDGEWCEFLAANNFLVGLSVDGTADLNVMRRFPNGKPAHDVAMRAAGLLTEHKVEFNVLVVISQANVDHPGRVFQFLLDNDLHYAQFIPCTEPAGGGQVSEHSITAEQYGDFLIALFDAWIANDDPTYYVRRIDNWLHLFFDLPPECCEYREDCSNLVTIEWNGDVYPCDFFVEERFRMGNVREATLMQMLSGPAFRTFAREAEALPAMCRDCRVERYCHGGCYRHRMKLGIEADGRPYLCEAKQRIFDHVFATLARIRRAEPDRQMHAFLNRIGADVAAGSLGPPPGGPPPGATPAPPQSRPPVRSAAASGAPRRNGPCPCGSGKKFKHCCGGVAAGGRPR